MDGWIKKFENEDYASAMARLVAMHRIVGDASRRVKGLSKRIEVATLVVSVITSGALWLLVSMQFPDIGVWLGAALSTLVTGLTIFQATIGPRMEADKLEGLYSEFGRSLAHARSYPDNFSWHNFKHLESSYVSAWLRHPTEHEIRDARITGMI